MSKRISKQTSSLAFWLQKTYERIMTAKPSLFIVGVAAVALALFLLGGGIYDMMVKDIAVAYFASGGTLYVFYPSLSEQFLLESMLVMIFGAIGFAGFLIAYRSTKYAYNPRQAYRLLLVGSALLLIGYILIENGLLTKFGLA
ncbi:MAG TPA: hypothetical protein ENN36_02690 [Candidatus Bathyarchaeota archaeon]|nr:hypothetical protein [Candidatus Bathyarchaeota archaeon]